MGDRVLTVALGDGRGCRLGVVLESWPVDEQLRAYEREQRFLSGEVVHWTAGCDLYCWDRRYLRAPRPLTVDDLVILALVRTGAPQRNNWTSRVATVAELDLLVLALGYKIVVNTGTLARPLSRNLVRIYMIADERTVGSWCLTPSGLRAAARLYKESEPADDDEVPI